MSSKKSPQPLSASGGYHPNDKFYNLLCLRKGISKLPNNETLTNFASQLPDLLGRQQFEKILFAGLHHGLSSIDNHSLQSLVNALQNVEPSVFQKNNKNNNNDTNNVPTTNEDNININQNYHKNQANNEESEVQNNDTNTNHGKSQKNNLEFMEDSKKAENNSNKDNDNNEQKIEENDSKNNKKHSSLFSSDDSCEDSGIQPIVKKKGKKNKCTENWMTETKVPRDLLLFICNFLDFKSLLRLETTSQELFGIARSPMACYEFDFSFPVRGRGNSCDFCFCFRVCVCVCFVV